MHPEAYEFVRGAVRDHGPFRSVVEIGGRDINGSVRPLFAGAEYVALDLLPGPGVDVVVDMELSLWTPARPVDCVVCCEVLEHAENAEALVRKAWSWLRHGGALIMTCATHPRQAHSALDGNLLRGAEEFYRNVSAPSFRSWCAEAGFIHCEAEVNEKHGDLYAVATR